MYFSQPHLGRLGPLRLVSVLCIINVIHGSRHTLVVLDHVAPLWHATRLRSGKRVLDPMKCTWHATALAAHCFYKLLKVNVLKMFNAWHATVSVGQWRTFVDVACHIISTLRMRGVPHRARARFCIPYRIIFSTNSGYVRSLSA